MATKKVAAKKSAAKKTSAKKAPAKKNLGAKGPNRVVGAVKTVPVVKKSRTKVVGKIIDIEIKTKGETFKGKVSPDGISEFIQGLGITSTNTATIVKATAGKKTFEAVFNVHFMRRLLRQDLTRRILTKRITLALGI